MRKNGFTLAEVLITLTIIGVVAALSIPQFTANVHNQSNASKLANVIANYENAFGIMLLREDMENIFETNFGTALASGTENDFRSRLENYIKVSRVGDELSDFGYLAYNYTSPFMPAAYASSWSASEWTSVDGEDLGENHGPGGKADEDMQVSEGDSFGDPITGDEGGTINDLDEPIKGDEGSTGVDDDGGEDNDDETGGTFNGTEGTIEEAEELGGENNNGTSGTVKTINNQSYNLPAIKFGAATSSGAVLLFTEPRTNSTTHRRYSTVFVDTNGSTAPNMLGRDIFEFVLAQDGHLYPLGSRHAAIESLTNPANQTWDNSNADINHRCSGSTGYNGRGCTARLIQNNYKVDY